METELCPLCGSEIEKGRACPFCGDAPAPAEELKPEPVPEKKAPLTDDEKLARIEQAYLDGKMTKEQYEKNKVKFAKTDTPAAVPPSVTKPPAAVPPPVAVPSAAAFLKEEPAKIEEDPDPGKECLSCGHVIGSKSECPRCAAKQYNRLSEKKIIAISMVLLLLGAVYLGAAGIYAETDITVVADIQESDNFRNMRIVGKVIGVPDFYPEKYEPTGVLRLLVDDGTGDIWVRLVSSVTLTLIEEGRIPGFGDTVDAEGALFVGDEGYMQVKVRDKNLFHILERNYTELGVSDLVPSVKSDYYVGQLVSVNGRIVDKFYLDGFAWIFDLADESGNSISVFMPETIEQLTGELDVNSIFLSEVNIKGALEWYEGGREWEIIPGSTTDITVTAPYTGDTYLTMTVGEMLANATALENLYVQVENVTVEWRYEDWLFSVSDSTTYDELSIFVDYNANSSTNIKEGDVMTVRGWVTYYDSNDNGVPDLDEWELKIREASSDFALDVSELWGGN